jgi:oligopeptide/dipeptide ABC transporter ATP-binding protein
MSGAPPLLEVDGLSKVFRVSRRVAFGLARQSLDLLALREVRLTLNAGETLGLVGESGCGKSTLARCIVGLEQPTEGSVRYRGAALASLAKVERSRRIQMIFQDPYASLNPRMTVRQTLAEVLSVHGICEARGEREDRIDQLLLQVGLSPAQKGELPHAFSGGQRQRISIARALALKPEIIVADEPVSALDVSIQAQIINLFEQLREQLGITYLFISHDLNVVRHISRRIAVMYLGQIVELAEAEALFEAPAHPYTRALLSAIQQSDPERRTLAASLEGELPDPLMPPPGCSFSSRCPVALESCRRATPALEPVAPARLARCYRAEEMLRRAI